MSKNESLISKSYKKISDDGVAEFLKSAYPFGKNRIKNNTAYQSTKNRIIYPKEEEYNVAGHKSKFVLNSTGEHNSIIETIRPERKPLEYLLNESEDSDIFLDVGAHLGVYSCFIGSVVDRTYSLEPHPKNIKRLKQNIKLNGINAEAYPIGLSNKSGKTDLLLNENQAGEFGATIAHENYEEQYTESVDIQVGNKFLEEHDIVPNILKIDVEGEEYEVIEGLKSTLKEDRCRLLYLEIHHRGGKADIQERGHEKDEIINTLRRLGYSLNTFDIYPGGTQLIGEK